MEALMSDQYIIEKDVLEKAIEDAVMVGIQGAVGSTDEMKGYVFEVLKDIYRVKEEDGFFDMDKVIAQQINEIQYYAYEHEHLREALEKISICTYENYNLSDVTNIAKEVLIQQPDFPKDTP